MMWVTGEKVIGSVFRVGNAIEKQALNNASAMGQAQKSAVQKEAQTATNAKLNVTDKAQSDLFKPIEVVNKTPQIGGEFGSQSYTLKNGNINLNSRAVTNGTFDFVVTMMAIL